MLPIFHNILLEANAENNRRLVLYRRQLRDHSNPFAMPERRFIELFRLTIRLVHFLVDLLTPHLAVNVRRTKVPKEIRILVTLRFYATGGYQRSIGEDFNFGLSQTCAHRCIHEITQAICDHLADIYIKFPQTPEERNLVRVNFMNQFNFPGVIGAIDGTHVAIMKPLNEHNFINRKGYHSLNVQIICDSTMKVLNINANFGGSTHDSFIWRHSGIQRHMQQLYRNGERCWLIGDSGYPLQPYLLTPVLNAAPGTPEANYNAAHATARNIIERTIGLMKMRFRCILKERTARYEPRFVGNMVTACTVLHNLCIEYNVPLHNNRGMQEMDMPAVQQLLNNFGAVNDLLNEGRHVRQNIINRYFQ